MFTFTNPLLLWAFPVLMLPWIFRRRQDERIQHIDFPLLRFLKESEEKDLVNPKLQELLLLILRTLLLAALLFALAGPKWVSTTGIGGRWFSFLPFGQSLQSSIVALDTSYSMAHGQGDASWWKRARLGFDAIDNKLAGFSTGWILWDQSTLGKNKSAMAGLSRQDALDQFEQLPSKPGAPVNALLDEINANYNGDERVILLTDGQRYPWLDLLNGAGAGASYPPVLAVMVGEEPLGNIWLDIDPNLSVPWGIAAWETIAGSVKRIGSSSGANPTLTVVNQITGKTLYSESAALSAAPDDVASAPFQATFGSGDFDLNTPGQSAEPKNGILSLSIQLDGEDSLALDNRIELEIPTQRSIAVGLAYNTASPPPELEFMATALNPHADAQNSPVAISPIAPPDTQFSPDYDMAILAPSFARWWYAQSTSDAMEYARQGGVLAVFTGGRPAENEAWNQLLAQLNWQWLAQSEAPGNAQSGIQDGDAAFFVDSQTRFGAMMSVWDNAMWNAWLPERHGRIAGEQAAPIVSYSQNNEIAHIVASLKIGEGDVRVINAAISSSNETLWSPIFPAMLWELEKLAARKKGGGRFVPPARPLESDIRLLSDEDKALLTQNYNIQFADLDTIDEKISELYGGLDLRFLLLFVCIALALVESWLSNRLASL